MFWTNERKIKVLSLLDDCKVYFTTICSSNFRTSGDFSKEKDCDLIIGYSEEYDAYAAWNAFLLRNRHTTQAELKKFGNKKIEAFYTCLNDGESAKMKYVIIPSNHLEEFCLNWYYYLYPCISDKNGFDIHFKWADRHDSTPKFVKEEFEDEEDEYTYRDRIISEYYERNPLFRRKILNDYEFQCAICRTSIKEILEAAHIKPVANHGSDSLGNGICLCCNHHTLFDKHLIKINKDFTFKSESDELNNDECFQEIYNKYNGKIIVPLSKRNN